MSKKREREKKQKKQKKKRIICPDLLLLFFGLEKEKNIFSRFHLFPDRNKERRKNREWSVYVTNNRSSSLNMHIQSQHGGERSRKNYRLKYIHHLNYWKNTRNSNYWILFENPIFHQHGKNHLYFIKSNREYSLINKESFYSSSLFLGLLINECLLTS